ncbi:MAG: PEP-CTERM sorting domain-containing protein [Planctomycetota bacterium]
MKTMMVAVPAALTLTAASANAALVNGDFQTDAVSGIDNQLVPSGWSHSEEPIVTNDVSGVRDNGPLADVTRDQFFYMNQFRAGNSALLFQDTGIVIVEGYTYILTADVGEQSNQPDDDLGRIGLYGSTLGTGTDFAELTDIDPGPNGISTWDTFQTQFTATSAQAGQTLGVYLGFGAQTGETTQGLNVSFDNVSVTEIVPEPGSLALVGLGGLCLLRRRRG